jgi:hypothetical protein
VRELRSNASPSVIDKSACVHDEMVYPYTPIPAPVS